MALGKLPFPGLPANLDYSRAKTSALAVCAGGVVWTFFPLIYLFSTEILSERTVKPNRPAERMYCPKGRVRFCIQIRSILI